MVVYGEKYFAAADELQQIMLTVVGGDAFISLAQLKALCQASAVNRIWRAAALETSRMWRAAVRLASLGWGFAEDNGRGYSSEDFENHYDTFEPHVSFGSPVRRLHCIDKCMTALVASLVRFTDLTTLQFSRLAGTTDATLHAVAAGCPNLSRFTLAIHTPTLITPSGRVRTNRDVEDAR